VTVNTLLTKKDYENLAVMLETLDIKGRKSAEYIAALGLKLDARVRNWFDKHPSGFDIIETAKTSGAFEALVKEGVGKALEARDRANAKEAIVVDVTPIRAGYMQDA